MDLESRSEEPNFKFRELRSLIEYHEKTFQDLKAKAGQVAAWYVIFGCIMYVPVTLPSAVFQGNCWISVGVVASVAIAFWPMFITTVKDCLRVRQQQDSTFLEQEKLHRSMLPIQTGQRQDDGGQQSLSKSFAFQRFQRQAYAVAVYSALLSFTLLVLYGLSSVHRR